MELLKKRSVFLFILFAFYDGKLGLAFFLRIIGFGLLLLGTLRKWLTRPLCPARCFAFCSFIRSRDRLAAFLKAVPSRPVRRFRTVLTIK